MPVKGSTPNRVFPPEQGTVIARRSRRRQEEVSDDRSRIGRLEGLRVDEAVADGVPGEVHGGFAVEFSHEMGPMCFDGLYADPHLRSDFFAGFAVGDQTQSFDLAIAERFDPVRCPNGLIVKAGYFPRPETMVMAKRFERGQQFLDGFALEDVTAHVRAVNLEDAAGRRHSSKDEDFDARHRFLNLLRCGKTIATRHLVVGNHDVRLKLDGLGNDCFDIGGEPADFPIGAVGEDDARQSFPDNGMIVGNKDAGGVHPGENGVGKGISRTKAFGNGNRRAQAGSQAG